MRKLSDLLAAHGSDKHTGDKTGHAYGPFYDELFTPLRDKIHSVLELGVLGGASLRAWRDFFPDCFVIGLDHAVEPREEWQISVRKADVTKADEVDLALGNAKFDFCCDDGSHWLHDQIKSWEIIWPRIKPGGIWVTEDVQNQESHQVLTDLGFEIVDLRSVNHRWDDVLAVFRKPHNVKG